MLELGSKLEGETMNSSIVVQEWSTKDDHDRNKEICIRQIHIYLLSKAGVSPMLIK